MSEMRKLDRISAESADVNVEAILESERQRKRELDQARAEATKAERERIVGIMRERIERLTPDVPAKFHGGRIDELEGMIAAIDLGGTP